MHKRRYKPAHQLRKCTRDTHIVDTVVQEHFGAVVQKFKGISKSDEASLHKVIAIALGRLMLSSELMGLVRAKRPSESVRTAIGELGENCVPFAPVLLEKSPAEVMPIFAKLAVAAVSELVAIMKDISRSAASRASAARMLGRLEQSAAGAISEFTQARKCSTSRFIQARQCSTSRSVASAATEALHKLAERARWMTTKYWIAPLDVRKRADRFS